MPSALIAVKDASGATVNIEKPIVPARANAADSRPVVLSNEDFAKLAGGLPAALGAGGGLKIDGSGTAIPVSGTLTVNGVPTTAADRGAGAATANTLRVVLVSEQTEGSKYKDVAASQASTVLGTTGATGDYLAGITVFPESLNPGQITLQDGALTAVIIFQGGTGSVVTLVPFWIPLGNTSVNGAWKVVTGASVHLRASGNLT